MKILAHFRFFIFLLVILLASLYELSKDYNRYQAKQNLMKPAIELIQTKD